MPLWSGVSMDDQCVYRVNLRAFGVQIADASASNCAVALNAGPASPSVPAAR